MTRHLTIDTQTRDLPLSDIYTASEVVLREQPNRRDSLHQFNTPHQVQEADSTANEQKIAEALLQRHKIPTANPWLVVASAASWVLFSAIASFASEAPALREYNASTVSLLAIILAVGILLCWLISRVLGSTKTGSAIGGVLYKSIPWCLASAIWFILWEVLTVKTGWLAPPFFASPQHILAASWNDRVLLAQSVGNSLLLLGTGFFFGSVVGVFTGLSMGWSKQANYWLHPLIIFIGPVPALAWVPIVFVAFPTAYSAAVFMIALSVWFPMAVLTRAGVLGVPKAYFDVAQTLGAKTPFLIWRISIPGALPSIFTGFFMSLGASFVTLTIAETFGVNSGLGWYIKWKQGWSAYPAMYGSIFLMVLFCGGLLVLLFAIRSRVLHWQQDLLRW